MIRVVFDTVVFVRSLLNPRSIWGQLVFQHFAQYRLFVSQPVVLEILEVLQREELTRRFQRLPGRNRRTVIEMLAQAEVAEVTAIPARAFVKTCGNPLPARCDQAAMGAVGAGVVHPFLSPSWKMQPSKTSAMRLRPPLRARQLRLRRVM